jgi:hypothetical protein
MKTHQLPVGQQLSVRVVNAEQPGIFDTLFKSPDFVEDTERSAVYTFCPAEKISHLVSSWTCILRNWHFQIILWEAMENNEVKIQCTEIVESEYRRSDRRVTRCVNNIFLSLRKFKACSNRLGKCGSL